MYRPVEGAVVRTFFTYRNEAVTDARGNYRLDHLDPQRSRHSLYARKRGFVEATANITPDSETGIGKWTDRQIKTAIKLGQRADGSKMFPPMAYQYYQNISNEDMNALIAYLRSLKPIKNMRKVRHIPPKKK